MATIQRNSNPALLRTIFGFKINSAGNPIVFGPLDLMCQSPGGNAISWPPDPVLTGTQIDEVSGNTLGVLGSLAGGFGGGVITEPNATIDPQDDPNNFGLGDMTGMVAPSLRIGDAIQVEHDGGSISGTVSGALAQYPVGNFGSSVQAYRVSMNAPAGLNISGAIVKANNSVVGMFWLIQTGTAGLCIRVEDIKVH